MTKKIRKVPYVVYIIRCADDSLYTGITTDLVRRFEEHARGTGARYTRAHGVSEIVYSEPAANRAAASKREAAIKKLSRQEKIRLVHS